MLSYSIDSQAVTLTVPCSFPAYVNPLVSVMRLHMSLEEDSVSRLQRNWPLKVTCVGVA
jgi:hypothetical protein